MVPNKDNPKKVATGGNWAAQGYWVPYVVALSYVRHWSYEYRYLFVLIWGNAFPDTCKKPEQQGWRDNALEAPVIAAARRESEYFLSKARALIREPGKSGRKKVARNNTVARTMTVPSASEEHYRGPNTSQAFPLSPPLPRTPHHVDQAHSFPFPINRSDIGNSALPVSSGYYDPVRESRAHKLRGSWIQSSDFDQDHPQMRTSHHQAQIDEWGGKRKRCPEEVPSRLPRKKTEQHKQLLSTELSEQQAEDLNFRESGIKSHTYWSPEDRCARVHGAGKDLQMQEYEAATALMLLAGHEAELLGWAAITA
ncbi:hypothetical protein BGX38DRAFT_1237315 [Terfezia claveryi]|nr:hypothetical protein BGX38DRAFT_1237315 [Terfezia claveryi]